MKIILSICLNKSVIILSSNKFTINKKLDIIK